MPKAIQSIWNALANRNIIPHIPGLEVIIVIIAIAFIGMASSQTGRKDGIKSMYDNLLRKLWDE
jgi:uncharacterized membrane protein